uniref:Uncharacterized protein n=1 Tax=Cucumis sativus TaxID=3659 RepID=A0A0A0LXQ2_CUCSA
MGSEAWAFIKQVAEGRWFSVWAVVFSQSAYASGASVVIALLFLPLLIACREEFLLYKLKKQNHNLEPSVTLSIIDQKVPNSHKPFSTLEEIAEISPSSIFSVDMVLICLATFAGSLVMLVLAYRTREYYRWDVYKNYKEDMWIPQAEMEFYRLDNKKNIDD